VDIGYGLTDSGDITNLYSPCYWKQKKTILVGTVKGGLIKTKDFIKFQVISGYGTFTGTQRLGCKTSFVLNNMFYAMSTTRILVTDNKDIKFYFPYTSHPLPANLPSIRFFKYVNGLYIFGGTSGASPFTAVLGYSSDISTPFTITATGRTGAFGDITYGNGKYIVAPNDGVTGGMYSSSSLNGPWVNPAPSITA
jgi:hypothetical protein